MTGLVTNREKELRERIAALEQRERELVEALSNERLCRMRDLNPFKHDCEWCQACVEKVHRNTYYLLFPK
jgi:hypothetical protein